jgi:hypothetical protein
MLEICEHFGVLPSPEKFVHRLTFHSKALQVVFSNDVQIKQEVFSCEDKARIQHTLVVPYEKFLNRECLQ